MSEAKNIPRFGVFDPTVDYEFRPGGYVIVRNERHELLTVSMPKGLFLPGGAQEEGETLQSRPSASRRKNADFAFESMEISELP